MDSGLGASAHAWSCLLLPPLMGSQLSPPHSCLATTATLCPQQEPGAGVGRLGVDWWHLRMGHCSGCPCAVLAAPWRVQQVTRAGGSPAHFCSRYLGHPGMSLQYSWGSILSIPGDTEKFLTLLDLLFKNGKDGLSAMGGRTDLFKEVQIGL